MVQLQGRPDRGEAELPPGFRATGGLCSNNTIRINTTIQYNTYNTTIQQDPPRIVLPCPPHMARVIGPPRNRDPPRRSRAGAGGGQQWCKAIVVCRVSEITSQVKSSHSGCHKPLKLEGFFLLRFVAQWYRGRPLLDGRSIEMPGRF